MTLQDLIIDSSWSLFLDRDGVVNKKLPNDYVKKWEEFEFLTGVQEAIRICSEIFGKVFIVTNQQGIGKGIMTERDLEILHNQMMDEIRYEGGNINKIYHSPYRAEEKSVFRKPNPGMARKAKIDFPIIEFNKSIVVGDSISDMEFGKNSGMYTVFISSDEELISSNSAMIDFVLPDLKTFAAEISKNRSS